MVSHAVLSLLTTGARALPPLRWAVSRRASLNRSLEANGPARPGSEPVRYTPTNRRLELAQTMQQLLSLVCT